MQKRDDDSPFDLSLKEQYAMIVDQSPLLISHFDRQFRISFVNKAGLVYFGKNSLEEMAGHAVLEYVPEAWHVSFVEQISRISRENPCIEMENPVRNTAGELRYYKWIDQGIFDRKGFLQGYQSIGQDVTQIHNIEQELIDNRVRLVQSQKIGNMGDWERDLVAGSLSWSEQIHRILGFNPVGGVPDQDLFFSRIPEPYRQRLISQQEFSLAKKMANYQIEYPFTKGSGGMCWIREQGQIEYDTLRNPVRITGTILDITDFKELQLSLENRITTESIVVEVSTLLMKSTVEEIEGVIGLVLGIIGQFFKADRCSLLFDVQSQFHREESYEWTAEGQSMEGAGKVFIDDPVFSGMESLFQEKGMIFIPDTGELSGLGRNVSRWFRRLGTGAFWAVPLSFRGRKCGYLTLDARLPRMGWSPGDKPILNLLGELCLTALERKQSQEALTREKELLGITLMSIGDGFISLDSRGCLDLVNSRALEVLGREEEEIRGRNLDDFFQCREKSTGTLMTWKKFLEYGKSREARYLQVLFERSGSAPPRVLSFSVSPIPGRSFTDSGLALIFRDVTEEMEKQEEIAYLSFHDILTGVYNRAYMEEELRRLDTERQLPLSIIIGDVNGLKLSNDVFGHQEGDNLLKVIAGILRDCCREEDIIARWGGDEFSVILPRTPLSAAETVSERIRRACAREHKTAITPSIALGEAVKLNDSEDIQLVLKEAEARMYRRKIVDEQAVKKQILETLKSRLYEQNGESREHIRRMEDLAGKFSQYLGLPESMREDLTLLARTHDLGKVAVSPGILDKSGGLEPEEWEEIRKHSMCGYQIARASAELSGIADYILSHHERWDGRGYPRKLAGNRIPELSRIFGVLDAYESMVHRRPFREALSREEALEEIRREAGRQFDPVLADKFLRFLEEEPSAIPVPQ